MDAQKRRTLCCKALAFQHAELLKNLPENKEARESVRLTVNDIATAFKKIDKQIENGSGISELKQFTQKEFRGMLRNDNEDENIDNNDED